MTTNSLPPASEQASDANTIPDAVPDTIPEAVPNTVPGAVSKAVTEAMPYAVPAAASETVPDASAEVARLTDAIWPHAVRAAATLHLADHIAEGGGDVTRLAARAELDPDALERLLAYLSSHGVFHRTAPGHYDLNPAATLLLDTHPSFLRTRLDQNGLAGRLDRAATHLVDAIRTGEPVYESVYGRPYYEDIAADPRLLAEFDGFARWYTSRSVPDVLAAYDWSSVKTMVDVGGGSGMLLTHLLKANPHLHGTLVDLPPNAAEARKSFEAEGLTTRAEAIGGSFFDPLPEARDIYLLSGVLIDWNDRSATEILRRCAEACTETSRVLVAEQWEPDESAYTDEDLRILILVGGRVRPPTHLAKIATPAGLTIRSTHTNPRGLHLVELEPATPST
ncbi:methyltransferase [Sphaerisporangium rubeum]|uniref:Methyltransferase n=1 Tax=Sphaerisporangium rubeum TaxID=321317 RepID=A0A7X0IGS7_9ACTN|nr:hypothetical protein [Sphaerisporangium rubeum]